MKKHIILGTILAVCFTLFGLSNKASALSLDTSRLGLNYRTGNQNYGWTGEMLYGDTSGGTNGVNYINLSVGDSALRKYYFRTPSVTPTGNFASVHFETQIAVYGVPQYMGYFPSGNLPYMNIIDCNGSTGGFANNEIIAKDLRTETASYNNGSEITIRFIGNFTMKNIGVNSGGQLTCTIGSNDFAFFTTTNSFSTQYINRVFFDENPMSVEYSNNINDALLQQQVYQNNTIINQNQQTYDYLTDNTPPDVNISNISGSAGWLPAGPVDSILTLPIQLAQGIVNVFTNPSQCTPLNIPLPWVDYTMTLPCVGPLMDQIGFSPIWATIGGIISAFIIYDTLKWLYKFVDDTLTLRENNSGLWGGL